MKKVVHLTSAHQRYDQRILWRECFSLCEHGYDVTLVVNDAQKSETLENGVKILSTGFVPQSRKQRMTEGVERVYAVGALQNADIYHLHDPELLRIALRLKQNGKRVVFDSHEFYGMQIRVKEYLSPFARFFIAKLYTAYEAYVCRRLDGVVVPTRYNGEEVFINRSQRVAYVNNYPRLSEYEGISIPCYITRKNICYCGGLSPERGISNLVRAGMRAKVPVILAGLFNSEAYKLEVLNENNRDFVQYLGFMNQRKDVFAVYAHCAIGAALVLDVGQYSKLENLSTKVYEFMASEMPVLLSDFPYNRYLIEKYHFGLLANPSDVDDIASKITWLVEHPNEAEEMGKNGKRLLEEQFTWERGALPELLRLYKEIE